MSIPGLKTVDLVLRVARSTDNRLTGTVAVDGTDDARDFSGTLELMRVFEDLVPAAPANGEHETEHDTAVPARE
jgi:hypothetical protein